VICDARALDDDVGRLLDSPAEDSWSDVAADAASIVCDPASARPTSDHSHGVNAVSIILDRPLAWSAFSVWLSLLLHAHGERILRVKALLDLQGWPNPVVLDAVHHLIHPPIHLNAWPSGARTSRLVIIAQELETERIEPSLRAFLAAEP
jgi:G3E family GTPase